jgi:hypothetical protein
MSDAMPTHDFNQNSVTANTDAGLKYQLVKFFGTDALSLPAKSELVSSTCDVVTWAVMQARTGYVRDSKQLVSLISASQNANALAAWGETEYDWIVISEGLMEILRAAADDMGDRLAAAFPELSESQLGRRLLAIPPLKGRFRSTLGSVLYFAAISFFVGHEAGHHLSGHDGYYVSGAHAEADDHSKEQQGETKTVEQALEHQADQVGLTICRIVVTKLLSQLWDVQSFSDAEKVEYQRVLAILLSGGAFMSVVKIKPKNFDWSDVPGGTHPPAVVRVISMAMQLSAVFKENFGYLNTVSRKWIRLKCLELAVGATIKPGSDEDRIFQARLARAEPAAIRAVGIRKALHDPQLKRYYRQLQQCLETVRPHLRPRTKSTSSS